MAVIIFLNGFKFLGRFKSNTVPVPQNAGAPQNAGFWKTLHKVLKTLIRNGLPR